jgi:hypothetical protein
MTPRWMPICLLTTTLAAAPIPVAEERDEKQRGVVVKGFREGRPAADLSSCRVHLVPLEGVYVERSFPCGVPFDVPVDGYRLWVEDEGLISMTLRAGLRSHESPHIGLPLEPAGRVTLPESFPLDAGLDLRLFHFEDAERSRPVHEHWRSRALDQLGAGVPMPIGQTVALLWDRAADQPEALSRPFRVSPGSSRAAPLAVPEHGSQLFLRLERAVLRDVLRDRRSELAVETTAKGRRRFEPELIHQADTTVLAVWYDLPVGEVILHADLDRESLLPQPLTLEEGRVAYANLRLTRRPTIEVRVRGAEPILAEGLEVDVRSLPRERGAAGDQLARAALTRSDQALSFPYLPPVTVDVLLPTSLGTIRQRLDLSDGVDRKVVLDARPIDVEGRVVLGEAAQAATLRFDTLGGDVFEVATEADGVFRLRTVAPLGHVAIAAAGSTAAPYHEYFAAPIRDSGRLDFHLPAGRLEVEVMDSGTGLHIAGAAVHLQSYFAALDEAGEPYPPASPGDVAPHDSVALTHAADPSGYADFRFLRPGRVKAHASAEGYAPHEPILLNMGDGEHLSAKVQLRRIP